MTLAAQISLLATRIGQEIKTVKAFAVDRGNHTGTQSHTTILDFDAAVDARVIVTSVDGGDPTSTGTDTLDGGLP